MKQIIRLKNWDNYGEKLDDLYVGTDGEGNYILGNDKSVWFASSRELLEDVKDYDNSWGKPFCEAEDKIFLGEIFFYQNKYGYLNACMEWIGKPVDNIEECKYWYRRNKTEANALGYCCNTCMEQDK